MKRNKKALSLALSLICSFAFVIGNFGFTQRVELIASAASPSPYTSDYIYNVLETDEEREFYDRLYDSCATVQNSTQYYAGAPYAKYSDLIDYERALEVAWLFYYDHPEFFWISSSFRISSQSGISFGIYADYTDGTARKNALSTIMSEAQEYIDGANEYTNDYDKAKFLHDELIENVIYVEGEYDQSILSVFIEKETVCAGYTKAYSMLCNAVGIDAVSITGYVHGWNAVNIYGNWYLVDVTNDTVNYDMFLISESAMQSIDIRSGVTYTVTTTDSSGNPLVIEAYMHDLDDVNFPTYYDDYPYCPFNYTDVTIPITQAKAGDISCNGEIDLYDAIEVAKFVMGMRAFTDEEYAVADYTQDGTVDLYDVIEIARELMV